MTQPDLSTARIGQVGIVVKDLDAAIETYSRVFGIGPWRVHLNSAPPMNCTYRGEPASYRVKVALAQAGSVMLELIQYLDGDTIHRDFLDDGKEGVEHLGIYVEDLSASLSKLAESGVKVLQSAEGFGANRDGKYAYLDTAGMIGTILELIQPASDRRPPQSVMVGVR